MLPRMHLCSSLHAVNIALKFRLDLPVEISGKTTRNITPHFFHVRLYSDVSVIVTF
jgi:hypothetical protein